MKDEIIQFLRSNPKQHFNARQIARHLELHSRDHKALREGLRDLVHHGKIILHPEERYSCRDESKVLKGTIKLHNDGYGFLLPESQKKTDVFIPARFTNFAMNGDTVLVASERNNRDGRYEGRVIQVLSRAHEIVVGQLKKIDKQFFVMSSDAGMNLELYIPQKALMTASEGDLVAAKIVQYPGPGIMAVGEIQQVIGTDDNDENLTNAVLLKHGIRRHFPKQVITEVEGYDDEVSYSEAEKRVDLGELPIITIDGETARDFDDAVCVIKRNKTYILYVSIADVSAYVKKSSSLDEEAYRRATSVYLPNECIPMLPEKLSNGLCSLNPHVPRLTITAELHYNENFEFIRSSFYKSIIRSHKRATYNEVQAFLDGTGGELFDAEVQKSIHFMKALSEQLILQTEKRGTLGFDLPEAIVVYDAHGKIQNIQRSQRFFSHRLIEAFMIAANVAVAQYFTVHGLPQLYRIHDKPDPIKIQQFLQLVSQLGLMSKLAGFHPADFFQRIKGHEMESFLHSIFLRSLKQAQYDAENVGHYGLSLDDYAHFTSPIRRYPDLIVHRQLKALMDQSPDGLLHLKKSDIGSRNLPKQVTKKSLPYNFQDLKVMGAHCSKMERTADETESEVLDTRKAIFIRGFMHEKFFGRITRLIRHGMVIELDPYFVEGFLPVAAMHDDYYIYDEKRIKFVGRRLRKTFSIGDRIWVTLSDVKVQKCEIRLELLENQGAKPVARNKHKSKKPNKKSRRARRKR